MPNVLDVEPLRAIARRLARKITEEKTALRFEKFAFTQLLDDARNFRPALPLELERAPEWAREAHGRGEAISVFHVNDAAARRLRTFARKLADTCKVAEADPRRYPGDASSIAGARRFLTKIDSASFDVALGKAKHYARTLAAWEQDQDREPLCEEASVSATCGRTWSRVRSPGELRATGRAFVNCLARASTNSYYISMMRAGLAQYWVLRDADGKGLIVAMLAAPVACEMFEVRGPRNAHVCKTDPDLLMLQAALSMHPSKRPPPPPPPTSGGAAPSGAARQHCQCRLCRMLRERQPPLREHAAVS